VTAQTETKSHLLHELETLANEHGDDAILLVPALERIASWCHRRGEYDEAQQYYERALRIVEQKALFATERMAAIRLHHSLGLLHRIQNKFPNAEPHYKLALELARKQYGEQHEQAVTRQNYLAGLYCAWERYDESEQLLKRSLQFYEQALGKAHEVTALTLYALALVTRRAAGGEVAPVIGGDCKSYYDRAGSVLNIDISSLDVENQRDLFRALMRVSYDRFAEGRFDEAEELFRHALLTELNEIWPRHTLVSDTYQILGDLSKSFGTAQQSEHLYKEALGIRAETCGENHQKTAATAHALGVLLIEMQRPQDAEPYLRQASEIYRTNSDAFPPLLANSLKAHAKALRLLQQTDEAAAAETEADEIYKKYGHNAHA
jgi:tetratricopeptide (TPR) repeat protein